MAGAGISAARLQDRHVLVTGAARGIGAAVARGVAAHGAVVTCIDLDPAVSDVAAEIAAGGGRATAATVDLCEADALTEALDRSVAELGGVDAVVACAGGAGGVRSPFLEIGLADWEAMIARNLTTTFVTASVLGRHLAGRGGGSIVLFSSMAAEVPSAGLAHYGAAKGAIRQLTRSLALELAEHGIRVNAVAPGVTVTPGNEAILQELPADHPFLVRTPLRRFGEAAEIVGAVVYLVSDESSFTSGSTIAVDGGFSVS